MRTYLALIAIDLKLALRLRAVIIFNYLFPLIVYFIFGTVFRAGKSYGAATQVMTMSLSLGILGNGLFGAGIRALQERELNILRRYKVTPITPGPLLTASMITGWVVFLPYIVLLLALTHYRYGMAWPQHMASLLAFISLGLIAFRSIGLVIASVANTMQEGTILVQLLYFPMLFLSGATIPTEIFQNRWLIAFSKVIPARYLVDGIKDIMLGNKDLLGVKASIGALALTVVVGLIVGTKLFRWEKEEKVRPSAKLWVLAVLLPFLVIGLWNVWHP